MPSLLKILTNPENFTFYGGGEFKQKSLPYDSIAAGGPSAQPAVVKPIPEGETLPRKTPDFLLRGGSNWASTLGEDVTRITKFFKSPEGINFAIKQNLLPIIVPSTNENGNSKITYDATNAAELFSQISRNAYSPVSTLAQVAVGAINGIHFDRSVTGIKTQTYSSINNVVSPIPVGQNYSIQNGTVSNLEKKEIPVGVNELDETGKLALKQNPYNSENKFTTGSRAETYKLSYIIQRPDPTQGQPTVSYTDDITNTGVIVGNSSEETSKKITDLQGKDLVEFSIQVINNNTPSLTDYIFFRAYIDSLTDSFAATWDPYKFVGRGESFYNYTGFTRGIALNFKIFCGEDSSYMAPTYEKLNYLVSTMTPDYSRVGYARANLIKLTIGGYMKNLPGFLTNLSFNIPTEYGWDVTGTKKPRFIDVTNFAFTPIHTQLPRKGTPLIN